MIVVMISRLGYMTDYVALIRTRTLKFV